MLAGGITRRGAEVCHSEFPRETLDANQDPRTRLQVRRASKTLGYPKGCGEKRSTLRRAAARCHGRG